MAKEKTPENPFKLPSERDVFRIREREKERKRVERERQKNVKVWEKTTQCSRLGRTKRVAILNRKSKSSSTSRKSEAPEYLPHRREMESMSDFLAKKREMFLVQMSLDTKKEEIKKLEEKARLREEALSKSEKMLEEDAIRFDTFLKQNDKKSHEAIKRAEVETKKKQEKMQEIKKVKQEIQMVQTEMSKLKETLDLCEEYKQFLDALTPEEWFEEHAKKKTQRQEAGRVARHEKKLKEWNETKRRLRREQQEQHKHESESSAAASNARSTVTSTIQIPDAPKLEDEELTDSESEEPMYFKEPQQLLDIFTSLEENNLFLIQNAQETEQTLEELKQDYADTKASMDSQKSSLKSSIDEHVAQISREEAKTETIRRSADVRGEKDAQDKLLNELHDRVLKVYVECGFDGSSNPTTLSMLTDLEGKLEFLLSEMELMDPEYVEHAEKLREKERREKVRIEKLKKAQEEYEERLKRSMARSNAPVEKKKTKKIMFRSQPITKTSKKKSKKKKADSTIDSARMNSRYFS